MTLPRPEHDLANREPVWLALSELYLDTELTAADNEAVAATLAASPYTLAELRCILLAEVHPACVANLLQVADVWSGFDRDWLQQSILRRRRWPSRLLPFRRSILAEAAPLFARASALRHVDC